VGLHEPIAHFITVEFDVQFVQYTFVPSTAMPDGKLCPEASVTGAQTPLEHCPPKHEWPQAPQLFGSNWRFTQFVAEPHAVVPVPQPHAPERQLCVPGQVPHETPQRASSPHTRPLQFGTQTQLLPTHVSGEEQPLPQPPQLLLLLVVSTHVLLQVE
jgi:hypothetical protein